MTEVEAIVSRVDDGHAFVSLSEKPGGCGRCNEVGGCASGLLGQVFRPECRIFRLPNSINAMPGERVIVTVADGVPMRMALFTYLVPVLLLVFGAYSGVALGLAANQDVAALAGGGVGLLVGVAAGYQTRRGTPALQPRLARRRNMANASFEEEST